MKINSINIPNFLGKKRLDINFKEFVTFITGPNGCGKSTLLYKIYETSMVKTSLITLDEILSCKYNYNKTENPLSYLYELEDEEISILENTYNNLSKKIKMINKIIDKNYLYSDIFKTVKDLNNLMDCSTGEFTLLYTLVILLKEKPELILLDGIDSVLHIDVQQELMNIIVKLFPNTQIIMSTHIPSTIINGWQCNVITLLDCLYD